MTHFRRFPRSAPSLLLSTGQRKPGGLACLSPGTLQAMTASSPIVGSPSPSLCSAPQSRPRPRVSGSLVSRTSPCLVLKQFLLPSQLRCPPSFPPRAPLNTRVPPCLSAFPRRYGSSVSYLCLLLRTAADREEGILDSSELVIRDSTRQSSHTVHLLKEEEYGTEIARFPHSTSTKTTSPLLLETFEETLLLCEPRHAALPSIKKRVRSAPVARTQGREPFVRRVSNEIYTAGSAPGPAEMASALHQAAGLLVFYREPPDPGVFFRQ